MMTRTQAKTRLLLVAQVATQESRQHPRTSKTKSDLARTALQLAHLARITGQPSSDVEPAVIESYLAEGIALVTRAAATRIEQAWKDANS